jgi:glycosyltransferase involved in cell wall biosynthesis
MGSLNKSLISVIMPVYNSEKYLAKAIESILNQTYKNFEFIIINDGSNDSSVEIIKKYIKEDKRIILIDRKENKGIVYSLIEGINQARGEFIARMDADDVSLPKRFEIQIEYMIKNKLDVCGSFIQLIRKGIKERIINFPIKHTDIRYTLLFGNVFSHPTVIFRRKVFQKVLYNPDYEPAEDYKLWCDILVNTDFKVGNVPEVLLYYRKHGLQFSIERSEKQRELYSKAKFEYAKQLGEEELYLVKELIKLENNPTVKNFEKLINKIINFCRNREIPENVILYIIREIYNKLIKKNLLLYYVYLKTTRNIKKKFEDELFLFLKSILPVEQTSQIYQLFRKAF